MDQIARPFRSVLYIPGSKQGALEKARQLPVDVLIFDLEDSVLPGEKAAARAGLARWLGQADYGPRLRMVRINGFDTAWGREDARAFSETGVDALLIPKVTGPGDIQAVADLVPQTPLWAMMETAAAVLNAPAIAAHPRLAGMVMGTNDLLRDLGARARPDRLPLHFALAQCLLAARAEGRVIVDGVYNAFRDEAGLRAECEQGRDMGFDGKTLIHPDQLAIANAVFAPSEDDLALARRQITAFDAATAAGQGVAVVDGKIVENLHIVTARTLLAKAGAIAAQAAA
jgi:(3S)-malyl-CoA thioesterase